MNRLAYLLNRFFSIVICVLISASILAFVAIQWQVSKYSFSFTPQGIKTYLSAYGEYQATFTATIATIAAYLGLHRLNAAIEANVQKVKQDRFSEWKTVLEVRCIEIEKYNPCMKREFITVRFHLYEELHNLNFNIENKDVLTMIFEKIFITLVPFFEDLNETHINMGGVYPNSTYSYSLDAFHFLFIGSIEYYYEGISADIRNLYLANLSSKRIIDPEIYKTAQLRNIRDPILR